MLKIARCPCLLGMEDREETSEETPLCLLGGVGGKLLVRKFLYIFHFKNRQPPCLAQRRAFLFQLIKPEAVYLVPLSHSQNPTSGFIIKLLETYLYCIHYNKSNIYIIKMNKITLKDAIFAIFCPFMSMLCLPNMQ